MMDFTQFDRLISLKPSTAAPQEATAISLDGSKITFSLAICGKGIFRLRMNPIAKPDYGLVSVKNDDAATAKQAIKLCEIHHG